MPSGILEDIMAELIDFNVAELPRLYCIGKTIDVINTGENPIPAQWQLALSDGTFEKLAKLPNAYSEDQIGLIHSWPRDMSCFKYTIGKLFTQLPPELDGLDAVELAPGKVICGYVRGVDASYVIAQAHDLVLARAEKSGLRFDEQRIWLMEGYNTPRFTVPDKQGRIVFDYYIPVIK